MNRDFVLTIYYNNGYSKGYYPIGFMAENKILLMCKQALEKGDIKHFTYEYNERCGNTISRVSVSVYPHITISRERRKFNEKV